MLEYPQLLRRALPLRRRLRPSATATSTPSPSAMTATLARILCCACGAAGLALSDENRESCAPDPDPDPIPAFRPICDDLTLPSDSADVSAPLHLSCALLMTGDTLTEDLSLQLNRMMRERNGLDVRAVTRRASLISRPGRFNFAERLAAELEDQPADIIIVMLGLNEAQPLRSNGEDLPVGTPAWEQAYAARVQALLDTARARGCDLIWVGIPIVRGAREQKLQPIRALTQQLVRRSGFVYIDTTALLSDGSGTYIDSMKLPDGGRLRLRMQDGAHMTRAGNRLLVERLLPVLEQRLRLLLMRHPERLVLPEQADRLKPFRFRIRTF